MIDQMKVSITGSLGSLSEGTKGVLSLFCGSLLLLASGCMTPNVEPPQAIHHPISETVNVLSHTADIRASYLIERNGKTWFIAEPPPDASISYDEGGGSTIGLVNTGDSVGEGDSASGQALPLAGRASYVLLARDLSYRLMEATANLDLSSEQYMTMYTNMLRVVSDVALEEAKQIQQTTTMTVTTGATAGITSASQITEETKSSENVTEELKAQDNFKSEETGTYKDENPTPSPNPTNTATPQVNPNGN